MAQAVEGSMDSAEAVEVRDALVDKLRSTGMITSPVVERAFRAVPRHLFVPQGTPLEVAYNADESVAIKKDANGVVISSTSAPFIQARMIEQAGLTAGMSVLEVGSGGYNAALLAEVVGPDGRVVSVDIDPEVVAQARARLEATGYGRRVIVVEADAEERVPGLDEPVDAIVVTVGAWDLAPVWLEQLAGDGRIVVPLRMNGVTRSIAFRHEDEHLVSTSAEVCGFVPMQGPGSAAHPEQVVRLPDGHGHCVRLRFDSAVPPDVELLDEALVGGQAEAWSGVTIAHGVSFADLHLWFAAFLPGFCKLAAEEGTELAERKGWFPFGAARGDSFAYLAVRPALGGAGVEFGAQAYGPHGEDAATLMARQIQAWDERARGGPVPTFAYWPNGAGRPEVGHGTAVVEKTHGLATICWPTMR